MNILQLQMKHPQLLPVLAAEIFALEIPQTEATSPSPPPSLPPTVGQFVSREKQHYVHICTITVEFA